MLHVCVLESVLVVIVVVVVVVDPSSFTPPVSGRLWFASMLLEGLAQALTGSSSFSGGLISTRRKEDECSREMRKSR